VTPDDAPHPSPARKRPWLTSLGYALASIGAPFVAAGLVLALLISLSPSESGPSLWISPLLPVAMAVVAVAAMTLFVRRSTTHPLWVWVMMAIGACALSIVTTMVALTFLAGIQSGWLGVTFGLFGTLIAGAYFACLGGPLWAAAGAIAAGRMVGAEPRLPRGPVGPIAAAIGAAGCVATVLATHRLHGTASVFQLCAQRAGVAAPHDVFTGGWSWFPLGWHCSWEAAGALEMPQLPSAAFAISLGVALLGVVLWLTSRRAR